MFSIVLGGIKINNSLSAPIISCETIQAEVSILEAIKQKIETPLNTDTDWAEAKGGFKILPLATPIEEEDPINIIYTHIKGVVPTGTKFLLVDSLDELRKEVGANWKKMPHFDSPTRLLRLLDQLAYKYANEIKGDLRKRVKVLAMIFPNVTIPKKKASDFTDFVATLCDSIALGTTDIPDAEPELRADIIKHGNEGHSYAVTTNFLLKEQVLPSTMLIKTLDQGEALVSGTSTTVVVKEGMIVVLYKGEQAMVARATLNAKREPILCFMEKGLRESPGRSQCNTMRHKVLCESLRMTGIRHTRSEDRTRVYVNLGQVHTDLATFANYRSKLGQDAFQLMPNTTYTKKVNIPGTHLDSILRGTRLVMEGYNYRLDSESISSYEKTAEMLGTVTMHCKNNDLRGEEIAIRLSRLLPDIQNEIEKTFSEFFRKGTRMIVASQMFRGDSWQEVTVMSALDEGVKSPIGTSRSQVVNSVLNKIEMLNLALVDNEAIVTLDRKVHKSEWENASLLFLLVMSLTDRLLEIKALRPSLGDQARSNERGLLNEQDRRACFNISYSLIAWFIGSRTQDAKYFSWWDNTYVVPMREAATAIVERFYNPVGEVILLLPTGVINPEGIRKFIDERCEEGCKDYLGLIGVRRSPNRTKTPNAGHSVTGEESSKLSGSAKHNNPVFG